MKKKCLVCCREFSFRPYRELSAKYCSYGCSSKVKAEINHKKKNGFGFSKGHLRSFQDYVIKLITALLYANIITLAKDLMSQG